MLEPKGHNGSSENRLGESRIRCNWVHFDSLGIEVSVLGVISFLLEYNFDPFLVLSEVGVDHVENGLFVLLELLGFKLD